MHGPKECDGGRDSHHKGHTGHCVWSPGMGIGVASKIPPDYLEEEGCGNEFQVLRANPGKR